MAAVERRLTCEGILTPKSKHTTGIYDEAMRLAVRSFQQKHMIYESNYLRKKTVDALATPLLDNDYEGLVRAHARARGLGGRDRRGRHRGHAEAPVAQSRRRVHQGGARAARARQRRHARSTFFKRHGAEQFKSLRVAIKLPPRPEYYSDADGSFDRRRSRRRLVRLARSTTTGTGKQQPRKHYPHLTLFVK